MFGFFRKGISRYNRTDLLAAQDLYRAAIAQSRQEVFFLNYGVPDTVDGRFDILALHLYLMFFRLRPHPRYKDLSQCIFDRAFKDMDKSLREAGVGDVGVPKQMKKMMQAFNGRMHAYKAAAEYETEDPKVPIGPGHPLFDALRRNLYGTVEKPQDSVIVSMVKYTRFSMIYLYEQNLDEIALGNIKFIPPGEIVGEKPATKP